jgi:hypothetical protein
MNDRLHLEAFLTAVDGSPGALERPNCRGWIGDYQITGKHGHVLADQPGYLLYVVQRWKKAKQRLPGSVTQDGDDEGIIRLDSPAASSRGGSDPRPDWNPQAPAHESRGFSQARARAGVY